MFSPATLAMLPGAALAALGGFLFNKISDLTNQKKSEENRLDRMEGKVETSSSEEGSVTVENTNLNDANTNVGATTVAPTATVATASTIQQGGEAPFVEGTVPPEVATDPAALGVAGAELDAAGVGSAQVASSTTKLIEIGLAAAKIAAIGLAIKLLMDALNKVKKTAEDRVAGIAPMPVLNTAALPRAIQNITNEIRDNTALTEQEQNELIAQLNNSAESNLEYYENYVLSSLILPNSRNTAALDLMRMQVPDQTSTVSSVDSAIFDTVFGPPESIEGKFILSRDGIYYDSRGGSIPYITAEQITAKTWELQYAANRGGKGQLYDNTQTNKFADTIFSFNYVNESGKVKDFYKYDDVLKNIQNDKYLQIQDVSGKISDLIANGYSASSAIVKNYQENYIAITNVYEQKIKKRKKQLQLAALFGPYGVTVAGDPRGEGQFYESAPVEDSIISLINESSPDPVFGDKVRRINYGAMDSEVTETKFIPRIPINDFSFLKTTSIIPTLSSQQSVVLHSSDLDDTTLPIVPVFIQRGPGATGQSIPELSVSPYGTANWLNTSGDTSSSTVLSSTLSGIVPYLRTLDDDIITDGLVVCYNFLEAEAAVAPDSDEFNVRNYADTGVALNAKLVGDPAEIFTSGVSIPFLRGTLFDAATKYGARYSTIPNGSYVRLPNNYRNDTPYIGSEPLDNVMYSNDGWSMEFWAYVPGLSADLTPDHRYRIVAANENCGDSINSKAEAIPFITANTDKSTFADLVTRTKGMMIGWRDRGHPGTVHASGLEFVVLPTIAQNDKQWGKSVMIAEAITGAGYGSACRTELGFKVNLTPTTASGYNIAAASGAFTHYHISCDNNTDTISLYVNGQFISSSLVSTSFNVYPSSPLNIPTRIFYGHHHEGNAALGEVLYSGPTLPNVPIFTPWIIGGGYTDGVATYTQTQVGIVPGFLGTNTNSSYYTGLTDASGGLIGQHSNGTVPGLGGFARSGIQYKIPRSGLDGHVGSFKMYSKPLSNSEVLTNYKAQKPFFTGIKIPGRLI